MTSGDSRSVLLSVVSPMHNGSLYLEAFLQSVLRQSFSSFELIMVDDGSTDNSAQIIQNYQNKDSRIRLIRQTQKGAGSARNLGLSQAQGQYIIFLDCDDWFCKEFFKTMIDRIERDRSDVAVCEFFIYDQKTTQTRRFRIAEEAESEIAGTNLIFDLLVPNPWTKLYRTDFIRQHKLSFQEITSCNDWSFAYASLACARKISVVREPLVYYRTQTDTSISSYRYKRTLDIVLAIKHLKNELKKRGLFSQYREGFARRSLSHLVYEAFSGRKWKGFYILFRNLLMINDPTVCQVFIQKAFRYLCKRFARACH